MATVVRQAPGTTLVSVTELVVKFCVDLARIVPVKTPECEAVVHEQVTICHVQHG
jgi:hypothetical protein